MCLDCDNIVVPTGEQGLTGATGPQGTAGTNGSNGTNGTSLLYNNYSNGTTTATASYEVLDTAPLQANTMANGDMVHVRTIFTCNTEFQSSPTQKCRIRIAGTNPISNNLNFWSSNINVITIDLYITRLTSTTANCEYFVTYNAGTINPFIAFGGNNLSGISGMTGLNFATLQNITAEAETQLGETVQVVDAVLRMEYFKHI